MVEIIRRVSQVEKEDIGDLDFQQELPNGEGTKCDHCGKKIEEPHFLFGYKQGYRNFAFHKECLNQGKLFDGPSKKRKTPAKSGKVKVKKGAVKK